MSCHLGVMNLCISHSVSCFHVFRQYCNQNRNILVLLEYDILVSNSITQKNIEIVEIDTENIFVISDVIYLSSGKRESVLRLPVDSL